MQGKQLNCQVMSLFFKAHTEFFPERQTLPTIFFFSHWIITAMRQSYTHRNVPHMFPVYSALVLQRHIFFTLPWSIWCKEFQLSAVFYHKCLYIRSWWNLPSTLRSKSWMLFTCSKLTLRGSKGWCEDALVKPDSTSLPHISASDGQVNNWNFTWEPKPTKTGDLERCLWLVVPNLHLLSPQ